MEELLQDVYFWYTISFAMFLGAMWKFALPLLNRYLDARIAEIVKNLEEAENLRIEAQEMLAQYQRKHRDALHESKKIIEAAREKARLYKERAESELDKTIEMREKQLIARLERMEKNAINKIQIYAAYLSIDATREMIEKRMTKKVNDRLLEESISNIKQNVH
ncbi:MAG: hypothetical protein ACLFP8_01875 [Alphaproteobacteria bacterium]